LATNVFQNTSLVTNEFLDQLINACRFIPVLNNDYQSRFTEGMKVGETISIRKPPIVVTRSGQTFSAQDQTDQFCTMTVQTTKGVDLELTNREQMFNFTALQEQVIAPAAAALANDIELEALSQATLATANFVGVPGTTPATLGVYNDARALMFDMSAPEDDRNRLIVTSTMGAQTQAAGQSLFNPTGILTKAFEKGFIGRHAMADVFESQVVKTLTTGAYGGTPTVNGADQTGNSIITQAWSNSITGVVKAGDVLSFAGVNSVNRWTKQDTGRAAYAVVTADTDSSGAGAATIPIEMFDGRGLTTSGPYQNVTGSPADAAAISVYATAAGTGLGSTSTPQGIRFHRNAFLFASFDQPRGDGGVVSEMKSDPKSGLKIRFMKNFDMDNNIQRYRFDVEWAFGVAYPELACRIAS
jgi:hypothetical protein